MTRLSSNWTFFYKRILPVFFIAILILFAAIPFFNGARFDHNQSLPFIIVPIVTAVIFYVVMKKLIFDLVDEVVDYGDALLVKNGDREDRIALSDIINVNYTPLMSPPRVTLLLRKASLFGDRVSFCAPIRFVPFASSSLIDDLIVRVDAARRAQG